MREKRPRWGLAANFQAALLILAVIVPLILFVANRSIWVELEITVAVISLPIFFYLVFVLHLGVRVDKDDRYRFFWMPADRIKEVADGLAKAMPTGSGEFTAVGAELGPVGLLIGILVDIVFSLALIVLLAAFCVFCANLAIAGIAVLALPLFVLFRRSIRLMIWRGRRCRGDLLKSAGYALLFTVISSVWLLAVILAVRFLVSLWSGKGM